jgi:hypothetical protein
MGIVCEIYCIKKNIVKELIGDPKKFEEYLIEIYTNSDSENHFEGKNFFYLDKAWDIALFLLRENDSSSDKLLSKLEGALVHKEMEGCSIISSEEVKLINQILINISENEIETAYDLNKMQEEEIYRAGWFTKKDNWEYILKHVKTIQQAFSIASNEGLTIIIRKA